MLPFLIVLLILTSCEYSNFHKKPSNQNESDISNLALKAQNHNISISERLKFLDSALTISTKNDSLKASLLYAKCNLHFTAKEYDSLYYYGERLKNITTAGSNYYHLGKYGHLMAYYHENITFQLDSAYYYNNLSKNYYLQIPDSTRALGRIIRQAILKNIGNDFFGAKETLTEALGFSNKNKRDLAIIYSELAANNDKLFNHTDAIYYYKLAIQTSDNQKDILGYKNNLATSYTNNGNYISAISILNNLINDSLLKKPSTTYARILDNLTYAQWKNGHTMVEESFIKALQIRKTLNDRRGQIASNSYLGEFYTKRNQKKAKQHLDTVIQLSKELNIPKAEQDALKLLMPLLPKNISIRDRYSHIQDSLYRVGLEVKTQFAKMQYDDQLKKDKIVQLETDTALKRAELAEERTKNILFISISTILIFLGLLFYYLLKNKHKKERILEVYQTEKRISKKIHDELANDIYGVISALEHSKSINRNVILDSLDNIYLRTRDISHQHGEINTKAYTDELMRLLTQFSHEATTITTKGLKDISWDSISEEKKNYALPSHKRIAGKHEKA